MTKLSPYGICYSLPHSPFTVERNGYRFHFSSELHMENFKRDVKKKEDWINDSLSKRFKCKIHAELFADIQLYCKLETRGFWVEDTCTDYLKYYIHPSQIECYVEVSK